MDISSTTTNWTTEEPGTPPASAVWGYGFLLVTVINLCSLFGVVMNPLSKKRWYRGLLLFMVAVAVGVLAGSSFLFLFAGALEIDTMEWSYREKYLIKVTVALSAIFGFYNFENILKLVLKLIADSRKQKKKNAEHKLKLGNGDMDSTKTSEHVLEEASKDCDEIHFEDLPITSINHHRPITTVARATSISTDNPDEIVGNFVTGFYGTDVLEEETSINDSQQTKSDGVAHNKVSPVDEKALKKNKQSAYSLLSSVKPVAWMIVFGDAIHNFMDGLTIGAAMSQSMPIGFSVCIAVLAEELPHEIGDLAVLLRSGLPLCYALGVNFLSACLCYLGFVFGALLGENVEASLIIYALAAGLFMYISLTDLLPEICPEIEEFSHDHTGDERNNELDTRTRSQSAVSRKKQSPSLKAIIIHLLVVDSGMILGYSLMVILAIFADDIEHFVQQTAGF